MSSYVFKGPPIITDIYDYYIGVREGDPFNITCDTEGFPPAEIHWASNNISLYSEWDDFEGHTIAIDNATKGIAGEYTCLAKNINGNDTKVYTVEVFSKYVMHLKFPLFASGQAISTPQ